MTYKRDKIAYWGEFWFKKINVLVRLLGSIEYFCLFVLPYEIREKIFEGCPPPVLKKSGPPC